MAGMPTANAAVDAVIATIIPVASDVARRYTQREFPAGTRTQRRNGTGSPMQTLPDSPIIRVESVQIGALTVDVSAGVGQAAGYWFDKTTLYLTDGSRFTQGFQNVEVTWAAGYEAEDTQDVPTGNAPAITPVEGGYAAVDLGVVAANTGTAFTRVTSAPAAGQYAFANGVYSFNTADANTPVTMTYDFVPPAVEQAVREMTILDLKQRTNLGQKSQNLNGQVLSLEHLTLPMGVKQMLDPFKKLTPV